MRSALITGAIVFDWVRNANRQRYSWTTTRLHFDYSRPTPGSRPTPARVEEGKISLGHPALRREDPVCHSITLHQSLDREGEVRLFPSLLQV